MKKFLYLAIVGVLVTGCSALNKVVNIPNNEDFDKMIEQGLERLRSRTDNFVVYEGSYLNIEKNSQASRLLKTPIEVYSDQQMNLDSALMLLEKHFNVSTLVTDYNALDQTEMTDVQNQMWRVNFNGDLEGFLGYLGDLYGVYIEVTKENVIEVSFYQTKLFRVDQFIDGNKSSASLSIGGGSGTSGGFSATSETNIESNTWDEIQTLLDDTIGDNGSATILQDFSMVQVTARPFIIKRLSTMFDQLKKESKMQVAIQYRIITVSKTKLNQLAAKFDLNLIGDNYELTSDLIDAISISTLGGGLEGRKRSVGGRLDAIVRGISLDVISEGQFVGLPNRVMPINLTTTTSYISNIEREDDANSDQSTTSIETSEIVTGLSVMIIPKILDDGRIQITSGFTDKTLISIESLSGVQLPTIDETETLTTVVLDAGNIELIALYTEAGEAAQKGLQLFGAGYEETVEDKIIAVIIGADSYKLPSTIATRG